MKTNTKKRPAPTPSRLVSIFDAMERHVGTTAQEIALFNHNEDIQERLNQAVEDAAEHLTYRFADAVNEKAVAYGFRLVDEGELDETKARATKLQEFARKVKTILDDDTQKRKLGELEEVLMEYEDDADFAEAMKADFKKGNDDERT